MSLGKRKEKQIELFVATADLAKGSGHPFYTKLNEVLAQVGFDARVEELCAPYYKSGGRPSIPPGVYFRMLFIGYFEGINSQRGIAWRCADSLALRSFLGLGLTEGTPTHASMTIIRQRLEEKVFDQMFTFVLGQLQAHGVLRGQTVGIDATTLEANAAMKSIVRKDNGADWKEYLRALAKAEGMENPSEEDLRRMDRSRKDKKVSNQDWHNPNDPDARIAKMKDGRTHLAYKAEHAVDLESEAIVSAHLTHADRGDTVSGLESLVLAQANLVAAGSPDEITQAVADKGYHDNELLARCADWSVRTYIPERKQKKRRWTNKPAEHEKAFRANRRRVRAAKGKRLNRWRSERVERTFAHVCETGGGRRTWLRGLVNVAKAHVLKCAAYNLGLLLRKVYGLRKPRNADAGPAGLWAEVFGLCVLGLIIVAVGITSSGSPLWASGLILLILTWIAHNMSLLSRQIKKRPFLTGC